MDAVGNADRGGVAHEPGRVKRPLAVKAVVAGAIVLALSGVARLYRLDADPSTPIVTGYVEQTYFRDEAAKIHEARNKALFGEWKLNAADEYQFWRAQSPVWVYGLYLWFRLVGVSYASARLHVVVYALAGLALLFWLVAARYGTLAAIAATTLASFNFAYLQYTRLALMEAVLIFYLLAATAALFAVERHPDRTPVLIPLSGLLLLAAVLTKASGLPFVLLVGGGAAALVNRRVAARAGTKERPDALLQTRDVWVALATFGAILLVIAGLFASPRYANGIAFQIREHVTRPQEASFARGILKGLVESLTGSKIHDMVRYLAPVGMTLALAEIARALLVVARRRRGDRGPSLARAAADPPGCAAPLAFDAPVDTLAAYMLAWFAFALALNLIVENQQVHFQLILFPPLACLGGLFAARLWHAGGPRAARRRWAGRSLVVLAALVFAAYHGQRYLDWITHATFTFPESSRELARLIGPRDAVVVGEYAAQATIETGYRHYYIRPGLFNDSRPVLTSLGITHLVAHDDDLVTEVLRRNAPELLRGLRPLGNLDFYGLTLHVYELAASPAGAGATTRAEP